MKKLLRKWNMYLCMEFYQKWYTRKLVADSSGVVQVLSQTKQAAEEEPEDSEKPRCYCAQPCYDDMICCDNVKYTIKWFQFDCLRIRYPPKRKMVLSILL